MIRRTTQMNINHQKLFEPLTKATFRLSPDNARYVISEAIRLCREEYPGPVHIGLPSDIAKFEALAEPASGLTPSEKIHKNDAGKIASVLETSRSPLIAVGLTAARLGTGNELLTFLEKIKIPVVLTPMAKGMIPEDHPCYAGVLFHVLSDYLEDIYVKGQILS